MPVLDQDVGRDLCRLLAGEPVGADAAARLLGMDLHADQPVLADVRAHHQSRACLQELDGLGGGRLRRRRGLIALPLADQHLAALLVEHEQLRVGQDRQVRDLLERRQEDRHVVAQEADVQAVLDLRKARLDANGRRLVGIQVGDGHAGQARGDRADILEVKATQHVEVDPEVAVLGQARRQNRRLDQDLVRLAVQFLDQLPRGRDILFVVVHDQHVVSRQRIAPRVCVAGGDAHRRVGGDGDLPVGRQHGLDERLGVLGRHVGQVERRLLHLAGGLLQRVLLLLGHHVNEAFFLQVREARGAEHRVERLLKRHPVQIGGHLARDFLGRDDVLLALRAQKLEDLAEFEVLHMQFEAARARLADRHVRVRLCSFRLRGRLPVLLGRCFLLAGGAGAEDQDGRGDQSRCLPKPVSLMPCHLHISSLGRPRIGPGCLAVLPADWSGGILLFLLPFVFVALHHQPDGHAVLRDVARARRNFRHGEAVDRLCQIQEFAIDDGRRLGGDDRAL